MFLYGINFNKNRFRIFLSFLFIASFFANISQAKFSNHQEVIELSRKVDLSKQSQWQLLLHYKNSSSIITDKKFFYAQDGDVNAKSELEATIEHFFDDENLGNKHAICRYPARFKWIKEQLNLPDSLFAKPNCSELKNHLLNTSAKKISIVFASENVNNLLSMMDDIFIKIEGEKENKEVSHAIGYFARLDISNIVTFIAKTLTSGTDGTYVLEPYQDNVDKYNDLEKRSLWEYKIKLSNSQLELLSLHIWEMREVVTKYKFIGHNCGNALLYLLAVTDPKLANDFNSIDAPIDIISNLNKQGYISEVDLMPAANYKLRMISDNFSLIDKIRIEKMSQEGNLNLLQNYQLPQEKANILAGLRTEIDYKLISRDMSQENYNQVAQEIVKNSETLPQANLSYADKNPLKKTSSSSFSIGYNKSGANRDHVGFSFYPVYNSVLNNNSAYFNEFDLQLMNMEGKYYTQQNKLRFDNIDLLKVKNIMPYDYLANGLSGQFNLNVERKNFSSNSNAMFPNLSIGIGAGTDFLNHAFSTYAMFNLNNSYFNNRNLAYAAPEIGFIFKEGSFGKINTKYIKYLVDDYDN